MVQSTYLANMHSLYKSNQNLNNSGAQGKSALMVSGPNLGSTSNDYVTG